MQDRPSQPLDSNAPQNIAGMFPVASTNQVKCDPAISGLEVMPEWITPELLERTRELWQRKGGTPVTNQDALEILIRVGALLDVLTKK